MSVNPRLLEQATAAHRQCIEPDIPDPWEFSDMADSGAIAKLVQRRVIEGRTPLDPAPFAWPKTSGGDRIMTFHDHLDQVLYRGLLSALVTQIESRLDRDHVMACRIESKRPWWRLAHHGNGNDERRRRAERYLDDPPTSVLGKLDVANFFSSIRPVPLRRSCLSLPGPGDIIQFLLRWLHDHGRHGIEGLPVGPESSAVLANFLLAPGDEFLRDVVGIDFVRYVDDIWLFGPTPRAVEVARDSYRIWLDQIDLRLNDTKWMVAGGDEARAELQSALAEYWDTAPFADGPDGAAAAKEYLDESIDARSTVDLKRALRAAKKHQDFTAVARLIRDPSLVAADPLGWRAYMGEALKPRRARKSVEFEALCHIATDPVSPTEVAYRLVLLEGMASTQPPRPIRDRLSSLVLDSRPEVRPVSVMATKVLARAKGVKGSTLVELAEAQDNLSVRRGLAIEAARVIDCTSRRGSRELRRFAELDAELSPCLSTAAA